MGINMGKTEFANRIRCSHFDLQCICCVYRVEDEGDGERQLGGLLTTAEQLILANGPITRTKALQLCHSFQLFFLAPHKETIPNELKPCF
jgi:hypothetical protein